MFVWINVVFVKYARDSCIYPFEHGIQYSIFMADFLMPETNNLSVIVLTIYTSVLKGCCRNLVRENCFYFLWAINIWNKIIAHIWNWAFEETQV